MPQVDFLSFPVTSIRRSIKDIDDSYRNPWDIYAELAQNAVDAIHKMQVDYHEDGKIEIIVNAQDKTIIFKDNGCGIAGQRLPELLRLFSSGKEGEHTAVGEKGVGLKFVYFQSKYFEIVSSDGNTGGKAIIKDARLWKCGTSDELLKLDFEEVTDIPRGTIVTLKGVEVSDTDEQTPSIFKLSFEQLKYILRNKTFIGTTSYLWEQQDNIIKISLKYIDYNGIEHCEEFNNEYILPTEKISKSDIVDLQEFEKWLRKADRSDSDKRNKLQGKILTLKGTYKHNNYRKISYWACFLPTRRDWDNINKNANLLPANGEVNSEWLENHSYCLFGNGIYTSTKGMPTGISVDPPNTGYAGYWPNCFMLFQDDALSFDIGRKSIHGKIQAIYRLKAKELFTKFTQYVTKYTSATPVNLSTPSLFDRYAIRQEISRLVDLSTNIVKFQKIPSEQEASVSAIFFELVGNGTISDIEPIYLGYRNKYDLYANFISQDGTSHFCFIEFKSHLKYITKDFSEAKKVFDEIDYLICWDVNDSDIQALSDFGINCEVVEQGTLHVLECPKSVTHRLSIPNCNPVYVIDLKKLM